MNFKGNIISAGNNAKTIKGDGKEYVTAIFYGTPFKLLIDINLYPNYYSINWLYLNK